MPTYRTWNLDVNYKMGDTGLGITVKEKDFGVTISADMEVSENVVLQRYSTVFAF